MTNDRQRELQQRLGALRRRLGELSARPTDASHAEEFVALFQERRRLEASLRGNPEPRFRNHVEDSTKPAQAGESENVLANVNRGAEKASEARLGTVAIVTATGVLMAAGLLAVLLPSAFLKPGLHFEITVSKKLACGLLVLFDPCQYLHHFPPHRVPASSGRRRFRLRCRMS